MSYNKNTTCGCLSIRCPSYPLPSPNPNLHPYTGLLLHIIRSYTWLETQAHATHHVGHHGAALSILDLLPYHQGLVKAAARTIEVPLVVCNVAQQLL
jgi:hypothetical protein